MAVAGGFLSAPGGDPVPGGDDGRASWLDGPACLARGGQGVTMVIDKGVPPAQFRDLMRVAAPFVTLWKLGFGTVALYPGRVVRDKVHRAQLAGVEVYVGGTFLELARVAGKRQWALDRFEALGVRWVEVSDGTFPMDGPERAGLIREAVRRGFQVVAEVGSKDAATPFRPYEAASQIVRDLETGARYVIVEARDSGRGVGLYDGQGRLRDDLLEQLLQALGGRVDPSRIIWEAPQPEQQKELLCRFGPTVGLGNVQVGDILTLAAMRAGLRSDTMRRWVRPPSLVDGRTQGE